MKQWKVLVSTLSSTLDMDQISKVLGLGLKQEVSEHQDLLVQIKTPKKVQLSIGLDKMGNSLPLKTTIDHIKSGLNSFKPLFVSILSKIPSGNLKSALDDMHDDLLSLIHQMSRITQNLSTLNNLGQDSEILSKSLSII